jgi:hypothetical protein
MKPAPLILYDSACKALADAPMSDESSTIKLSDERTPFWRLSINNITYSRLSAIAAAMQRHRAGALSVLVVEWLNMFETYMTRDERERFLAGAMLAEELAAIYFRMPRRRRPLPLTQQPPHPPKNGNGEPVKNKEFEAA